MIIVREIERNIIHVYLNDISEDNKSLGVCSIRQSFFKSLYYNIQWNTNYFLSMSTEYYYIYFANIYTTTTTTTRSVYSGT